MMSHSLRTTRFAALVLVLCLNFLPLTVAARAAAAPPARAAVSAPATSPGPLAALWSWFQALVGRTPVSGRDTRFDTDAGGCTNPDGSPCK
jgi:hypothetical protein